MRGGMLARETGDSIFVIFTRDPNRCAFARSRGLAFDRDLDLGLTPQALCCRPLTRAESRRLALILAHLVVERVACDAKDLSAATQVVAGRGQNPLDIESLDFV
jgi:hypothetical protein